MTTLEKTRRTVERLEKEVKRLQSFVIGMAGKDPEGDYKPAFVKRVLKAAKEKPIYIFKDSKSFLKQLKDN